MDKLTDSLAMLLLKVQIWYFWKFNKLTGRGSKLFVKMHAGIYIGSAAVYFSLLLSEDGVTPGMIALGSLMIILFTLIATGLLYVYNLNVDTYASKNNDGEIVLFPTSLAPVAWWGVVFDAFWIVYRITILVGSFTVTNIMGVVFWTSSMMFTVSIKWYCAGIHKSAWARAKEKIKNREKVRLPIPATVGA